VSPTSQLAASRRRRRVSARGRTAARGLASFQPEVRTKRWGGPRWSGRLFHLPRQRGKVGKAPVDEALREANRVAGASRGFVGLQAPGPCRDALPLPRGATEGRPADSRWAPGQCQRAVRDHAWRDRAVRAQIKLRRPLRAILEGLGAAARLRSIPRPTSGRFPRRDGPGRRARRGGGGAGKHHLDDHASPA